MIRENKIHNKWFAYSLFVLVALTTLLWNMQIAPWVTQAIVILLISIISLSWAFFGNSSDDKPSKTENVTEKFETRNNDRSAGLKLQGLGQLSLALEKFKQCPKNHDTANLIYNLAIDFQIKGEPENAKDAFLFVSDFEPNFKDVGQRIASFNSHIETQNEILPNEAKPEALTESPASITQRDDGSININEKVLHSEKTLITTADTETEEIKNIDGELSEYPVLYGSRYKVNDVLGQGTTGAVFKGKDIVTDQIVAIKVLNLSDELEENQLDEYKFRFHREIETAGNLSHPNIVKILDSGETEGYAYIAMEYVDGTNLRNYARADQLLHPQTVLKIIAQCADALAYAHKHDLIHRDIKPANIIYNKTDDYVKLTDFGIAKIPDSTRTRAGSILGTPLYMSPEQLAGERLDARSDLYSLGVTLYHLLTGSPPFRPKTMAELMRSITQEQHKDISEINPGTPSCIAWTVNKALEKDADKRFQSAASMANKLRECEMMIDS